MYDIWNITPTQLLASFQLVLKQLHLTQFLFGNRITGDKWSVPTWLELATELWLI